MLPTSPLGAPPDWHASGGLSGRIEPAAWEASLLLAPDIHHVGHCELPLLGEADARSDGGASVTGGSAQWWPAGDRCAAGSPSSDLWAPLCTTDAEGGFPTGMAMLSPLVLDVEGARGGADESSLFGGSPTAVEGVTGGGDAAALVVGAIGGAIEDAWDSVVAASAAAGVAT
jgi:hypothetical protein